MPTPIDLSNLLPSGNIQNEAVWGFYERELTEEDLALRAAAPARGTGVASIKTLRAAHHQLARLLATGMSQVNAAKVTGFCKVRISQLANDPAFQELMVHYQKAEIEHHADVTQVLASLSIDALSIIQERLLDNPEDLSNKILLEISKMGLDRTGHGPKSTVATEDGRLSQEDIDAIKENTNKSKIYSKAQKLQDCRRLESSDDGRKQEGQQEGENLLTIEGTAVRE